jgi:hypothetical protein
MAKQHNKLGKELLRRTKTKIKWDNNMYKTMIN